jgi:hypothetical protein
MSDVEMNREKVLETLRNTDALPQCGKGKAHRTIYEAGVGSALAASGQFYIDYASFSGGCSQEVPLRIIRELESQGFIKRAFPDKPSIKAWVLA